MDYLADGSKKLLNIGILALIFTALLVLSETPSVHSKGVRRSNEIVIGSFDNQLYETSECNEQLSTTSESHDLTEEGNTEIITTESTVFESTSEPVLAQGSDRYCEMRCDGLYSTGCAREFVACSGGSASRMICPSDLVFDKNSKECRQREEVEECGGTPAMTPSQNISTNISISPGEWLCQGLSDGFHTFGCSPLAVSCAFGKIVFSIKCPSDQKFDVNTLSCQNEDDVIACGGRGTAFAVPVVHPTNATELQEIYSSQENDIPNFEVMCEGAPNGMNAIGCSSNILICINEIPLLLHCPEGLAYEPSLHACLNKEFVSFCEENRLANQTGEDEPVEGPSSIEPESTTESSFNVTEFTCEGRNDGMYELGCSSDFMACVAGRAIPMRCPGLLKYDQASEKCLAACDVKACSNQVITEEPSSTTAESSIITGADQPLNVTVTEFNITEFNCEGLSDGAYAEGCSDKFVVCVNEEAFQLQCPFMLKFDKVSGECIYEAYIEACGGSPTESTFSVQGQNESSLNEASDSPRLAPLSCEGIPDGRYSLGCSSEFVSCVNGVANLKNCPNRSLRFDQQSQQCLEERYVEACGGIPTVESAFSPTEEPSPTENATTAAYPAQRFSCEGIPDGTFVRGCSSQFVACINGGTYFLECPQGMKFDGLSGRCLEEEFVAACGGVSTEPPEFSPSEQPLNNISSVAADEGISSSDGEVVRPSPPDFSCEGVPDGTYGIGCSSEFVACVQGNTTFIRCPSSSLKFDEQSHQCLAECYVPACRFINESGSASRGLNPTAATSGNESLSISTQQPFTPYTEEQTPSTKCPTRVVPRYKFTCVNKKDGVYDQGCSNLFVTCLSGSTIYLHCPGELKYDRESGRCITSDFVRACGGTPTESSIPLLPTESNTTTSCALQSESSISPKKVIVRLPSRSSSKPKEKRSKCSGKHPKKCASKPIKRRFSE